MNQPRANQLAHGSPSGVVEIATLRVGMQDEDQLVHRESNRVFIEEERQHGALRPLVFNDGGRGIERMRDP